MCRRLLLCAAHIRQDAVEGRHKGVGLQCGQHSAARRSCGGSWWVQWQLVAGTGGRKEGAARREGWREERREGWREEGRTRQMKLCACCPLDTEQTRTTTTAPTTTTATHPLHNQRQRIVHAPRPAVREHHGVDRARARGRGHSLGHHPCPFPGHLLFMQPQQASGGVHTGQHLDCCHVQRGLYRLQVCTGGTRVHEVAGRGGGRGRLV